MKLRKLIVLASVLTASIAARSDPPVQLSDRSVYQLESRWTTDAGRSIKLAELAGQYQIVAFIFTHCAAACPLLVKSLQVQARSMPRRAQERARFLLVSMDPQRDTAPVLQRYRKEMALDQRWTLLRASDGDVRELAAVLGFNYERTADGQFAHSNQITLLDPGGEIVLQHPTAEGAVEAVSTAIIRCGAAAPNVAHPHIAGKNCT